MIDTNKVEFQESKMGMGKTRIVGSLTLGNFMDVDDWFLDRGRKELQDRCRRLIHRECYGELVPLVYELSAIALKNVTIAESDQARRLTDSLKGLLEYARETNEGNQTSPAEEYWTAAIKVIAPLRFDLRVTMVQTLVAAGHEVPPMLENAVKALLIE